MIGVKRTRRTRKEGKGSTSGIHKVDFEFPMPVALVTMLIRVAKDVETDVHDPDVVPAMASQPMWGFRLMCDFESKGQLTGLVCMKERALL